MTTASVQHVRAGDPLLDGVDLTGLTAGETSILQMSDGDTAVVEGEGGPLHRGAAPGTTEPMVVLAISLRRAALPQRIAFPILTANVVRVGSRRRCRIRPRWVTW
ncbi:MAG: hypothetical protein R2848_18175 [Thermomicrobiales bacterium]